VQTLIIHQNHLVMKKTLLSLFVMLALTMGAYAQWLEQASGFSTASRGIQDMQAVDANIVWAAAYDGTNPTGSCFDFTKTLNGGNLWTAGTVTGATGTSIACISAVDGSNAWTCHYYPSGTGTKDGIYHTSDGGTTWTQQTTATFSNSASFPNCVWFWDANNGYCMGDPISGDFEIYTTTNGGTTWVQVPGANIPNPVSGEFGIVGYQWVVGNTVWFGTNKGRVYKSVDKGLNWTVATVGALAGYISPFMKDADYGFVMNKDNGTAGELAVTTDGGATWAAAATTGNVFTNDMTYVPGTPGTWVTTGADATNNAAGVTYSFDDGLTWQDMDATIGVQFLATAWLDNATAWAGGFNTDATTGGMYVFDGELATPIADFEAGDTAIALGGQVTFTSTSTGGPTSYLWTFQGGVPGTSTAMNPPAITYSAPGAYDVTLKVTGEWGSNTLVKTDYIYVGGVGMNELSQASVSIYPNPAKDVLTIQGTNNIQEVKLINQVGQVVLTQKVDAQNATLYLSNVRTGVYNLQVKMAEGFVNKKVVVN
jgi:PKD repeat protein